ncbi:transglutaminase family protein [Herbiconiux sp. L3-i23]|uniref:transglutaminase-like domain-containing protein n=1 Tax=Herbiconiux sp. L3-i23 TaxID=2905871 RepID=UPI002061850D|nr:transglutaminase-like domain-containing protein [Herbiconiux sp. L3-i23]BDI22031.1 cysteine protease [Herbiconiux sp. L3-i23]
MARRPPLRPTSVAIAVILIDLALLLGAWTFWPIHQSAALAVAVGVACAAATLIAVLGAVLRWGAAVVGAVTIGAYLVLGVGAAVPDEALLRFIPTVPGLARLISGSALSWKELLTISLPVGDYEALLIPVFLLTLLLGVVSLTIALRARLPELAILGPIGLFLAGILFGPTTVEGVVLPTLALLVACLAYLVWCRTRRRSEAIRLLNEQSGTAVEARVDRRRAGLRTAVGAGVILLLSVGGAVAATAVAPPSPTRSVLRSAIEKPFDPRDYPSPLSSYRRYFQPDRADEAMLTVEGLRTGELVRLATLDSYDGVVYSVGSSEVTSASGTFTRVPFALDTEGITGRTASVGITVGEYSGLWVPDAGALVRMDFTGQRSSELTGGFYYNAVSGTGAVLAGLQPGDSYRFDAVVPERASDDEIAALSPGTAPVPAPAVVPDELDTAVQTATADATSSGDKLLAAVQAIRERGYISHGTGEDEPFSRSGHSADRITELLTDDPMLGDAEQYAVTAALMAHQLGFPSRVVLGFALPEDAGDAPVDLVGADLTAWIEVASADGQWVQIDPNPPVRDIPEQQPEDSTKVARPQSVVQPPPDERIDQDEVIPPDVAEDDQPEPLPVWLGVLLVVLSVLGWILLAMAILLAPFAAVVAAKWQRRRRRRNTGTALERIGGGWSEFADTAADLGYEATPHATRYEVAMAVGGREPLVLAAAVDRATFAPGTPDDPEVDRVWDSVSVLRESMQAGRTRWERIKALVSVKSFARNREIRRRNEGLKR